MGQPEDMMGQPASRRRPAGPTGAQRSSRRCLPGSGSQASRRASVSTAPAGRKKSEQSRAAAGEHGAVAAMRSVRLQCPGQGWPQHARGAACLGIRVVWLLSPAWTCVMVLLCGFPKPAGDSCLLACISREICERSEPRVACQV